MTLPDRDIDAFLAAVAGDAFRHGRVLYNRAFGGSAPVWEKLPEGLHPGAAAALRRLGIPRLYRHQAGAIEAVRGGRNVIVASPTASGKSLSYHLPALDACLHSPANRALYLFPLKALARDQLASFRRLASGVPPPDAPPRAAVYDGDTTAWHRRKIRSAPPQVVITNPEMLHLAMLAHHGQWEAFFRGLRLVAVDEVHTLRGITGSHMVQVFRRLRRVASHYGAAPTFVCCTASVGNPRELAEHLVGLPMTLVEGRAGRRGTRHVLLVDPAAGLVECTLSLAAAAVGFGLRTIVYTQSRKLTEWIGIRLRQALGDRGDSVGIYRAGLLPDERRTVEGRLGAGEMAAVVTTSALELGIDIGELDCCILAGYPGSLIATWQRAGRVGRDGRASAVVLVAGEDALDRYYLRHPEALLRKKAEAAHVNPENERILRWHLPCAAAELPLTATEVDAMSPVAKDAVRDLVGNGRLLVAADGDRIYAAERRPHRHVDLRGGGVRWQLVDADGGTPIGEIDGGRVFREAHPGAIYLHGGQRWRVVRLDMDRRRAHLLPAPDGYVTRARGWKETEILETIESKLYKNSVCCFGKVKVTEQVTGYETRPLRNDVPARVLPLDLPRQVFETEGFWLEVPQAVQDALEKGGFHFMGAIHALEHAMIGVLPLLLMTDRNDFGGIAVPHHPQVGGPAVFVYDGVHGGAGLSRGAFGDVPGLVDKTRETIAECPCESGCPACVHSPKCGSGNRPIDKSAALRLLALLDRPAPSEPEAPRPVPLPKPRRDPLPTAPPDGTPKRIRYGVLDLETRRSAVEAGGWHRAERMGVSCAVLFDASDGRYHEYVEEDIDGLFRRMLRLDLVVGFNLLRFDYRVLGAYTAMRLGALPTLDLLDEIHRRLGYRLSLDHLARETLGVEKTADGLQALAWWKEGRLRELADYCRSDVRITRDLYRFGRDRGYLLFRNKAGRSVRVPASWGDGIP
jgi:DEAD/DEAH box helicase domain-containing protein